MLELLIQGLAQWLYGLLLEGWEFFCSVLLNIMDMDMSYIKSHVAVFEPVSRTMLAAGWALLMGNLVFQALRSMASGLGFEGEDSKLLFTRTAVFSFLLVVSPQICELCLDMTAAAIDLFDLPDTLNVTFADETIFGDLAVAWLLVILFGVIIMFQSFRLFLMAAERYVVLAILTLTAPLAFGMGGSKSTSGIFTGWCRMYGSTCLLTVLNVVFVKLLLSAMDYHPEGLDILPWAVLIVSIVKVARKADTTVTRIGLNPAPVGDPMGQRGPNMAAYMMMRDMAGRAAQAFSQPYGGPGPGPVWPGSSGSAQGTGPAATIPGGGLHGLSAGSVQFGGRGQPDTSQAPPPSPQAPPQGPTTGDPSAPRSTPSPANPSVSAQGAGNPPGVAGQTAQSTRKSSVPPGARRGPSYISNAGGPPAGTAAAGPSSRLSQNTSQAVHGGASNSVTQASQQTNVSMEQRGGGEGSATPPPPPTNHPGAAGVQRPQAEPGTARSTKRPDTAAAHPGTAGTAAGRSPVQSSGGMAQPAPAAQEPVRSSSPPPATASVESTRIHPGNAGTGAGRGPMSATRSTMRPGPAPQEPARASTPPPAAVSGGSPRIHSGASGTGASRSPAPSARSAARPGPAIPKMSGASPVQPGTAGTTPPKPKTAGSAGTAKARTTRRKGGKDHG